MKKKSAYVVFEAGNHLLRVVKAAKERGLHIIVIRTLPMTNVPPYNEAIEMIDCDLQVSDWLDYAALWPVIDEVCNEYDIVGSYAAAEITLHFESLFRQKHNLTGMKPDLVSFLLNKYLVRQKLHEHGLTELQSYSQEQALAFKRWPEPGKNFYFKPVNGAGSAQVFRCSNMTDLGQAIEGWNDKSEIQVDILKQYIENDNLFFLEQEAVGELMSVEGFALNGEYFPLGILSRNVLARDNAVEMGATFPYLHPLKQQIFEKVAKIHKALGVTDGPTHTEIVVTEHGDIELVELNIRFVGADVLLAINSALNTEIENDIVSVTLGEKPSFDVASQQSRFASVQYILPAPETTHFDSLEWPNEEIIYTKLLKAPDTPLLSTRFQMDQVGAFIVEADDFQSVLEKANQVRAAVKINGHELGHNVNNVLVSQ